jgi:adenosine deaminase
MDDNLKKFIEGMPKTELHLHLEGTFEPDLQSTIEARNELPQTFPNGGVNIRRPSEYKDLQDFLDPYYVAMGALRKRRDFHDLTAAYLEKVKSQNVTHVEVFFDPQEHTARGVPLSEVIQGINDALEEYRKKGISSKLIMSFVRHRSEKEAFDALEQAKPYMKFIDGFGLDSGEAPHPAKWFKNVYAAARKLGKEVGKEFKLTAHAGEEAPTEEHRGKGERELSEYIHQAIDDLKVDRIDHGNLCTTDPALLTKLAEKGIGLTMCPLSNKSLGSVRDLTTHPLKTLLDKGVKVTVNSDDPAYFGGYITENFLAMADARKLEQKDIVKLAQNAIDVSFMSVEEKRQHTKALNDYVNDFKKEMAAKRFVNPAGGKGRGPVE